MVKNFDNLNIKKLWFEFLIILGKDNLILLMKGIFLRILILNFYILNLLLKY